MIKSKITSVRMTQDDYAWIMSEYGGVQDYFDAMLAMDDINKQRDEIVAELDDINYAIKVIRDIARGV